MTVSSRKLLETIDAQCTAIPERTPGYRKELKETVADVIWAEREHERKRSDIVKILTDYCRRLGESAHQSASEVRQ